VPQKLHNKYRNRGTGYAMASHLAISVCDSKQMHLVGLERYQERHPVSNTQ